MMQPTFSQLDFMEKRHREGSPFGMAARCTPYGHPNPRFYKHYWWVFHRGSPCEGNKFLTEPYRLNEFEARQLMRALDQKDEPYMVYNDYVPRKGVSFFDPAAKKWKGVEFAPSFDDDTDPECEGYK